MTTLTDSASRRDDHIDFLDHMRGVAILLVFLFHCYMMAYATTNPKASVYFLPFVQGHPSRWLLFPLFNGWAGVPIFFVISGFCIHLSHQRTRNKTWRTFFIRRFFRIYPPYLIALLFFAFVLPVSRLPLQFVRHSIGLLGAHLILVHNVIPNWSLGINGSFWSIATEVQLYLIYPLLLVLVRRFGWNSALLVTLAMELALTHLPLLYRGHRQPAYLTLLTQNPFAYWFTWAIGARLADDWLAGRTIFLSRFPIWIMLAGFVATSLFSDRAKLAFLFAALVSANFIARRLANPPPRRTGDFMTSSLGKNLRWVGLVSYSLYLLHEPFIEMVGYLATPRLRQSPLELFPICFAEWPFILLIAWAFYRIIELPSIAWGKRIIVRSGRGEPPQARLSLQ